MSSNVSLPKSITLNFDPKNPDVDVAWRKMVMFNWFNFQI